MKIKIIISVICVFLLFNNVISLVKNNLKNKLKTKNNNQAKTTTKTSTKTNLLERLGIKKTEVTSEMRTKWKELFGQKQMHPCLLKDPTKMLALDPNWLLRKGKGKFWWVKQWGYDNDAYLFDFLDPVLRLEIVLQFKLLYNAVFKLPNKNPHPKSTLIINGVKQPTIEDKLGYDPWRDPYDVKHLDPKTAAEIDFNIHKLSINVPQLNQAIKQFNWPKPLMAANPGKKIVFDHDFNNDGRLSPREFTIAILRNNDRMLGRKECQMCFQEIVAKIDAMFTFMDCDNNGLIDSKDMYNSLPNLKRNTNLWNYFILAEQAKIRSHVTNDFVLKSMSTINGNLTKEEFRRGILYGFWNRQTSDEKILDGEERTLKHLRWRANMVDIAAERYIKAQKDAEAKKLEEMKERARAKQKNNLANQVAGFLMNTNAVFK